MSRSIRAIGIFLEALILPTLPSAFTWGDCGKNYRVKMLMVNDRVRAYPINLICQGIAISLRRLQACAANRIAAPDGALLLFIAM